MKLSDNLKNIRKENDLSQEQLAEKLGVSRIVLWCVKIFALLISIGFAFSFIIITALLVLSFLFVKTGLVFLGSLLALLSALIINFIILELLYNFIVSKKSKKNRISIMLLISLIFAGISIGVISIGVTQFDYIKDPQKANALENNFTIEMTDNLSINNFNKQVKMEYIETDNNEIKVTVNYSKFYNVNIYNRNETINIDIFQDDSRIMESIRDTIKDINNKEILDYHSPRIYVYASKDNIEKMQQNQYNKIEQNKLKK